MAFKMKGSPYKLKSVATKSALKQTSALKNYENPQDYKVFNMGNEPTPIKQSDPNERHFLEKEQTGPFEGEKKQLPRQPGEHPDLYITGGNQNEVIGDLEDRIEFVTSGLEEDPDNKELLATVEKLKERLEKEYKVRDEK